ncbi:hypothetical protein [Haloplanus salinarum]|uniref:hypothetical protein n=1 Tax=Haloplanus salinarum TaxID=1912324 RepID=UPI00214B568A|nr:hypothetical protein [Haloplanus salinarum]
MSGWDKQKEHITTHNLFQSAVFGEEEEGLVDLNFRVVGDFMYILDTRNDVNIEPPYTVLGTDTAIFFDFIEPGQITSEDVERISKYNEISREAVENHLDRAPISEDNLDPEEVEWFDHCTILRHEQFIDHQAGSAEQRQKLEQLKSESCIATVSPGTSLSLVDSEELRNGPLTSLLQEGISVPESPPNLVYLTREIEDEALVLAICEEIVLGSDLSDGGVALNFEDVKDHFGRDISYEQLENAFEYLRDINACRKRRDDGRYLFTKYALNQVLGIRDRLENETVEEHFSEDETETSESEISDFM